MDTRKHQHPEAFTLLELFGDLDCKKHRHLQSWDESEPVMSAVAPAQV
jgi:hypothetical protein